MTLNELLNLDEATVIDNLIKTKEIVNGSIKLSIETAGRTYASVSNDVNTVLSKIKELSDSIEELIEKIPD